MPSPCSIQVRVGGFRSDVLVFGALDPDGIVLIAPDAEVPVGSLRVYGNGGTGRVGRLRAPEASTICTPWRVIQRQTRCASSAAATDVGTPGPSSAGGVMATSGGDPSAFQAAARLPSLTMAPSPVASSSHSVPVAVAEVGCFLEALASRHGGHPSMERLEEQARVVEQARPQLVDYLGVLALGSRPIARASSDTELGERAGRTASVAPSKTPILYRIWLTYSPC